MKWTKEKRDALPAEFFGDETHRLFPVQSQEDLDHAAHLIGHASNPNKVKSRLKAIAAKLNLKLPDSWQSTAEFATEPARYLAGVEDCVAEFAEDKGDYVERICPVAFKAGVYEFKNAPAYEMTPEDIQAAFAQFEPVQIDDNHLSTVIKHDGTPAQKSYWASKGGFGRAVEFLPAADFSQHGLKLHVKPWVDKLHRDADGRPEPIPISCTYDRATKKLVAVAMTPNPRITEAAMFAAFAAEEETPVEKPADKPAKKVPAMKSPSHQKLAQFLHDHTAMAGAVCNGDNARTPTANFASESEMSSLQKMHDESCVMGAGCNLYKENLAKNRVSSDGVEAAMNRIPAFRSYHPEHMAMMSADESAPAKREPTAEESRLQTQLDRERQKARKAALAAVGAEAATFAAEIGGRLPTFVKNKAVDLYLSLASDDLEHAEHAEFSGEANGRPSRAAKVKELVAAVAEDCPMTRELTADDRVLFSQETTQTPDDQENARLKAAMEEKAAKEKAAKNGNGKH